MHRTTILHASRFALAALAALAALVLAHGASAQGRVDLGKREFDNSCASCHGPMAKGDGPMVKYLVAQPSDLTTLARRNGGVFPVQRVTDTIDGRGSVEIGAHGSREMPVWGTVYRSQAIQPGEGELSPDWYARNRIAALVDYLARVQQK